MCFTMNVTQQWNDDEFAVLPLFQQKRKKLLECFSKSFIYIAHIEGILRCEAKVKSLFSSQIKSLQKKTSSNDLLLLIHPLNFLSKQIRWNLKAHFISFRFFFMWIAVIKVCMMSEKHIITFLLWWFEKLRMNLVEIYACVCFLLWIWATLFES